MKQVNAHILTSPGVLIKETLRERNLSQKEFAKAVGVQPSHISEIINGRRRITIPFAQAVESVLDISAKTLMSMQMAIDFSPECNADDNTEELNAKVFLEKLDEVVNVKSLLKGENVRKLNFRQKFNLIRSKYGIDSVEKFKSDFYELESSCFRRSAKTGLDVRMIATWVIKAQYEALKHKPVIVFNKDNLDELCTKMTSMLHRNSLTDSIPNLLNEYGIGFCEVQKLEYASIDGYSFMKDGVPYIVITGRYNRIDNLAFTLMHELGHIYLGHTFEGASNINVDLRSYCEEDTSPKEQEADRFASDNLINPSLWKLTPRIEVLAPWKIQQKYTDWAIKNKLNPWIVLGRLSHETGIYKFQSKSSREIRVQKGGVSMN